MREHRQFQSPDPNVNRLNLDRTWLNSSNAGTIDAGSAAIT